jgi:hypothetical protein
MEIVKDHKWDSLKILPSDYQDYGGEIERWKDGAVSYPDCSGGCKWWAPLHDFMHNDADCDWGVCTNPHGPRRGLLTWEHQAGYKCFERDVNDTTG